MASPVFLGSAQTQNGSITSLSVTLTGNNGPITAGDLVLVFVGVESITAHPSVQSVTDTIGNTYQNIYAVQQGIRRSELWACYNAAAVPTGDSITIAMSGTIDASGAYLSMAVGQVAFQNAAYDGASAVATGNSTTPSATGGPWSQSSDLVFASHVGISGSDAASGWTNFISGPRPLASVKYQNLTSNAAVSQTFNINTAADWIIGVIGFDQVVPSILQRRIVYRR